MCKLTTYRRIFVVISWDFNYIPHIRKSFTSLEDANEFIKEDKGNWHSWTIEPSMLCESEMKEW